jgi:hypothetical protein
VIGDLRQLPAPADDALAQAHLLEATSYDLALGIITVASRDGETDQVLLAREELQQLDEHLTWVEVHRHHASAEHLLAEVEQARMNASRILEVLATP